MLILDAVVFVEMLVEKDRFITKAIEEKQNLVAQILNVPLQNFQHVAEVQIRGTLHDSRSLSSLHESKRSICFQCVQAINKWKF